MGRWVYIPDEKDKKLNILEWHKKMKKEKLYDALKDREWKEYWRGREAIMRNIPINLVEEY